MNVILAIFSKQKALNKKTNS